jgi:hypothetical protein
MGVAKEETTSGARR